MILHLLKPHVKHAQDSLQFVYQGKVGVENTILYTSSTRPIPTSIKESALCGFFSFLFFLSIFNNIQPVLLQEKCNSILVDQDPMSWITDYLTDRRHFVRMGRLCVHHSDV